MNRMITRCALLAIVLLAATTLADAASAHGKRLRLSQQQPAILGATVEPCRNDASLACLHVVGVGLHDGATAQLMLGDTALEIHALEGPGTNLFALLPEGLEPGVHSVQVSTAAGELVRDVPLLGAGLSASSAVAGYTTVSVATPFDQGAAAAQPTCPEGSVVVGGGYITTLPTASIFLNNPVGNSLWQVVAMAPRTSTGTLTGYAICLDPAAF